MIRIEECIVASRNLTTMLIEKSFSNSKKGDAINILELNS